MIIIGLFVCPHADHEHLPDTKFVLTFLFSPPYTSVGTLLATKKYMLNRFEIEVVLSLR